MVSILLVYIKYPLKSAFVCFFSAKNSSVPSGDKKDQNGGTVKTAASSARKVSSTGRTRGKVVSNDTQPEKRRVKPVLHGSGTGVAASTSSSAKTSIKVKLADDKQQQKSASSQPSERAKSTGSVRGRSEDTKTASSPILPKNLIKRVKETSGTKTSGAQKLPQDVKEPSRSHSPREKASEIKSGIVQKSASCSSLQTSQTAKAKNAASSHKSVTNRGKVTSTRKSAAVTATSDSVVVVGASESIIIPKIVISDDSEFDNGHGVSSGKRQISPVSPKQEVHPSILQEKQKYYRKKRPKAVSPIPESDDDKMAAVVTMESMAPVREAGDSAVNMNATTGHNNSSQSGADLEKAFTDLLDNFDKIGENDNPQNDTVHSSGKRTDRSYVSGDEIPGENKGHDAAGRTSHNSTADEVRIIERFNERPLKVVRENSWIYIFFF